MIINIKSKKADLMSIWWFFILVIVGTGIVIGVLMFLSEKIDVREVESQIIAERVSDCLSPNGKLISGVLDSDFDVFSRCGLDSSLFSTNYYYLQYSIQDNSGKVLKTFNKGPTGFEENCKLRAALLETRDFPACTTLNSLVLDDSDNKLKLIVIGGSRSEGK